MINGGNDDRTATLTQEALDADIASHGAPDGKYMLLVPPEGAAVAVSLIMDNPHISLGMCVLDTLTLGIGTLAWALVRVDGEGMPMEATEHLVGTAEQNGIWPIAA